MLFLNAALGSDHLSEATSTINRLRFAMSSLKFVTGALLHPEFDALCAHIEAYLAKFESAEEQGSIKWLVQRAMNMEDPAEPQYVVGGSELGVLLKVDKHKSQTDLINDKATFLTTGKKAEGGDATMTSWGHIMEPALARFVELRFGTRHFALEASVVHRSVKNFRYSPDGFVPICFEDETGRKTLSVAVLELKNPFGRVVKDAEMKVPDNYLPQVMSGMDVFSDLVSHGLFVEANYRIQALVDYGLPRYSTTVNVNFKGASINGETGAKRFDGLVCHDAVVIGFYPGPKFASYESVFNEIRTVMVDTGSYNAGLGAYDLGALRDAVKVIFGVVMELHAVGALRSCESEYLVYEGADAPTAIGQVRAKIAELTPPEHASWAEAPPLVMAAGLFKYAWVLHRAEPHYVGARRRVIEEFTGRVRHEVEKRGGLSPMFTDPAWVAPTDDDAELNAQMAATGLADTVRQSAQRKRPVETDFD